MALHGTLRAILNRWLFLTKWWRKSDTTEKCEVTQTFLSAEELWTRMWPLSAGTLLNEWPQIAQESVPSGFFLAAPPLALRARPYKTQEKLSKYPEISKTSLFLQFLKGTTLRLTSTVATLRDILVLHNTGTRTSYNTTTKRAGDSMMSEPIFFQIHTTSFQMVWNLVQWEFSTKCEECKKCWSNSSMCGASHSKSVSMSKTCIQKRVLGMHSAQAPPDFDWIWVRVPY